MTKKEIYLKTRMNMRNSMNYTDMNQTNKVRNTKKSTKVLKRKLNEWLSETEVDYQDRRYVKN